MATKVQKIMVQPIVSSLLSFFPYFFFKKKYICKYDLIKRCLFLELDFQVSSKCKFFFKYLAMLYIISYIFLIY